MRLAIGIKLVLGFLTISLLLAGISGFSLFELRHIQSSYNDLVGRREIILANSKDIRASALQQMSSLRDYLLTQNQEGLATYRQANKEVSDIIVKTLPMVRRDEDKEALNKLGELNKQFKESAEQAIALAGTSKSEAVQSAGAEHAASESQSVSTATEEQLASMEEISASAASLSDMAAELQQLISKFRL
ncbi:MCP four helix bundle domain-containing protein [Paenibacillus hamazuiensis]|uniref:MCP four helix bundle domain-containing protein n=1 Tax=Paenibacillus hamazuiensis TaxID=2936508 RepID=UPI00200C75BC